MSASFSLIYTQTGDEWGTKTYDAGVRTDLVDLLLHEAVLVPVG